MFLSNGTYMINFHVIAFVQKRSGLFVGPLFSSQLNLSKQFEKLSKSSY